MNIEIQYVGLTKSDRLDEQINKKMDKLVSHYNWITNASVFLKKEKHDEEKEALCEIRVSVPGPQLFAKSHEVNFNAAINEAFSDVTVQLEKKKEKMQSKR